MTSDQQYKIDFVLFTRTKGIFFNPHRPEGLEFIPSTQSGLRFELLPVDSEGDACGIRKGLECKLHSSFQVTKEQYEFVRSYTNERVMLRVSDDINLPFKPREEILISEDGRCKKGFSPRRHMCPPDIQQFVNHVESELASQTDQFLKCLRWRQGIHAPGEIFEHQSLFWRVEEGDYPLVPQERRLNPGGPGMCGIHWDHNDSKDMQELWTQDDITEPLGHTLLREAATLASESPRSSILMMTTALETSVKMHISDLTPDAEWLMEKIPSPPIFKILRDYIPLIHHRKGNELEYWVNVKPFIKKVQELIEIRNKVAHTGKIPDGVLPIPDYLVLVSDLLYLIDVLSGHDWAKSLASYEFRKALNWPCPRHEEFTFHFEEIY